MSDLNKETLDAVKSQIKEVQARCKHAWNVIDNSPIDAPDVTAEQIRDKALGYIEGLRSDIQNSNTPISGDANLLTSQFLKEMKDKTGQVEELNAFMKGSIHDIDTEINRLKALIAVSQEARSRPKTRKREVKPEHIHKAKEKFHMMKNELHGLIHLLLPNAESEVMEILGQLMSGHLNAESDGYIPITTETFKVIELLKDMNLVTANPYNEMEVKLAY